MELQIIATVRAETPDDLEAIREVNRRAFGREDEARLVDAHREGSYARLSLVAEEGGRVVGHIALQRPAHRPAGQHVARPGSRTERGFPAWHLARREAFRPA